MATVWIFKRSWRSTGLGCYVSDGYSIEPLNVKGIESLCSILRQRGIEVFDIVQKDILSDCTSILFHDVTTSSITQEHWECLVSGRGYLEPRKPVQLPGVKVQRPRYIKRSEVRKVMIQRLLQDKYIEEMETRKREIPKSTQQEKMEGLRTSQVAIMPNMLVVPTSRAGSTPLG